MWSAPVGQTRYVSVDGLRLWRYESLGDLQGNALASVFALSESGTPVYVY